MLPNSKKCRLGTEGDSGLATLCQYVVVEKVSLPDFEWQGTVGEILSMWGTCTL
jgi:hypothetical protein